MAKTMTKAKWERQHAKQRAMERYGISYGKATLANILNQIQGGGAVFVKKQTNRLSLFDVSVDGILCRVVYDRNRKEVVTFLPRTENR